MGDPEEPGGSELFELLAEIEKLTATEDRWRRLELLRQALAAEWPYEAHLADREQRRRLRVALLIELADALLQQAGAGRSEAADEALEVLSEASTLAEGVPELRATALQLLGMAALMRPGGRREDNVERAIEALGEAREVAEQASARAELDRLLAIAHLNRLGADRGASLELAARHAAAAAEGFDRERDPLAWASARFLLGESLRLQPGGDPLRAIDAFREAAEVKRERGSPSERAECLAALLELESETVVSREREIEEPRPTSAFDAALARLESARDAAEAERRRPRWVGTGFAAVEEPAGHLAASRPLAAGAPYLFWIEIGERPPAGAIDERPARLPDLEAGAELEVVLFGFGGGLEIAPGADVGRLRLTDRGAEVIHQPATGAAGGGARPVPGRLLFSVRAPERAGPARLRCNLYHRCLLLQSRLVTAWVAEAPPDGEDALRAALDFNLSASLDSSVLTAHGAVDVALMVNDDGDGAHGLRFWGGEGIKIESALGEGAADELIELARNALRRASWGSEREWDEPEEGERASARRTYRYHRRLSTTELRDDLVRLAIRGYRFYTAAIGYFEGDGLAGRRLGERLRTPGRVQIVERRNAGRGPVVLPVALFYDFLDFDSNLPLEDYRLCPDFERALGAGEDLAATACFEGRCPLRGDRARERLTVCPSGFWGFRHALGLPASVSEAGDAPPEITYHGAPDLMVAVSLDPEFVLRDAHETTLKLLRPGLGWSRGASRDEVLDLLRATRPHLVYFYCHGGLAGTLPYLLVGPPGERGITPDNLFPVYWERPRPLVVLNGCHTTALSPRHAFRFVDTLVRNSRAAGVIGTEITVFEELARDFAESCLRRFVVEELPIGEAVRRARLDLLTKGNPLGLVYIPYVLPGLRLRAVA